MPKGLKGFQKDNKFGKRFGDGYKGSGMLGKKHSQKSIEKMKRVHTGHKVPLQFLSKWRRVGEKNPAWKGGITTLGHSIRNCFKYRQWRCDVFTRDNFTCRKCDIRGGDIEADHYPKMFSIILRENKITSLEEAIKCEELWNINNGRTLHKKCHRPIKIKC